MYSPWFWFVDSHGGYQALLAHQRSYLGNLSSWPGHWSLQLAQERFLAGSPVWIASAGFLAALALLISTGDLPSDRRRLPRLLVELIGLMALCTIRGSSWWLALVWIWFASDKSRGLWTKSLAIVAVGWAALSVLTPFYHPYSRLWLPVEAFDWLFMGGVFVSILRNSRSSTAASSGAGPASSDRLPWFTLLSVLLAAIAAALRSGQEWLPALEPGDSLRQASARSSTTFRHRPKGWRLTHALR